jgi:vacuolar-type H+-ATPase subunit H
MKKLSSFLILVCILGNATTLFSQQKGNKQNSSNQGQNNQMGQAQMNPENMAGIFMYDADEVLKKIKVKETTKQQVITKAITKYNNKINELKAFNYETFSNVKTFLDKKKNEAMLNSENIDMKEVRVQANEMLRPIREKVQEQQALIKTVFERELSPKQFNTWIKYQEKKQNELKPKNLENPQMYNSGQHSKGSGQKQGMGRVGY